VDELPEWPEGTVAVLCTGGGAPHAIPVSTALREGPRAVVLALGLRRESLARLRAEPACALTVLGSDVAFTAHGKATVVAELERVAAVRLAVESIQDHRQPTFALEAGVRWRWTDAGAEQADAAVREALRAL
jgi:hypothetical protein